MTLTSHRFSPDSNTHSGWPYAGFSLLLQDAINSVAGRDLHYCEIGCGFGETALIAGCLSRITKVTSIDKKIRSEAAYRLQPISQKVTLLEGLSEEVVSLVSPIDILYIDGAHDYRSVKHDLENYAPLVAADGVIAGHDFSKSWPGVVQAVTEFAVAAGKMVVEYCDTSWRLYGDIA